MIISYFKKERSESFFMDLFKSKYLDSSGSFLVNLLYPPLVALLVLLGHLTGQEIIFGAINILFFSLSLWFVDSAKHTLIFAATFVYQISPGHEPAVPSNSDYFFTGARPFIIALLAIALISSFVAYVIRTEAYRDVSIRKCPLLLSMLLLAAAFIMNGFFSDKHSGADLWFGIAEAFAYFAFFFLFYFAFRKEDLEGIDGYVCYCTLWIAAIILIQLAHLFLTKDVFRDDGAIIVTSIRLGWGVSTVIGAALAVLIPILLYGAMRRRLPLLYFAMAFLALIGCFFSMSRMALGVGALFFVIGVLIGCFCGERKTMFQIVTIAMVLCIIVVLIGYYEKLYRLFAIYFEKGFTSSGRWALWEKCVNGFFDHPLFGAGFFGLELGKTVSNLAHNTIFQILGACGMVGIVAYLIYRIETIFIFAKSPSLFKTMMGLSAAALVVASLLDVFLFSFFPMIYHSALLALASIINREEKENRRL